MNTACLEYSLDDMAWTKPQHTLEEVNAAGLAYVRFLNGTETADDVRLFEHQIDVINNWKTSHNYPLNTFQMNLRSSARKIDKNVLIAQRIKRLVSTGCAGPRYTATGLPSPPRVLGTGALICFAGRGRPAVRRTPPAHNGLTPREARLPRTTRHRFALPGAQRWSET